MIHRFGPFELDPEAFELRCDGVVVEIEPQVVEVLAHLVAAGGRAVSKEELVESVWAGRFVSDAAVARSVQKARRALGERGGEATWIDTVRGRGYRFVGSVSDSPGPSGDVTPAEGEADVPVAGPPIAPGPGSDSDVRDADTGSLTPLPAHGRSLRWLVLAVIAILGGLGVWLTSGFGPRPSPVPAADVPSSILPRPSVAVLPLVNSRGDSTANWLSVALPQLLATELAADDQLRVVSGETVALRIRDLGLESAVELDPSSLASLRTVLASDFVVSGLFLHLSDESALRVDLRLHDAVAGETLASLGDESELAGLPDLAERLAARVREKLGAPPAARGGVPGTAIPVDPRAARAYADALAALRRADSAAARDALAVVLEKEPGFVPARVALATALRSLGQRRAAREVIAEATRFGASLPRAERLAIEALQHELDYDPAGAVAPLTALWRFFPDDVERGLRLAAAQAAARRGADALATVAELRRLPAPARDDPRIDLAEAAAARTNGDAVVSERAAAAAVAKAERMGATWLLVDTLLEHGVALRARGEMAQAIATFERAHQVAEKTGHRAGVAVALHRWGSALYITNDNAAADRLTNQALELYRAQQQRSGEGSCLMNLGVGALNRGQLAIAEPYLAQAYALFKSLGDSENLGLVLQNYLGLRFAQGDWAGALAFGEEGLAVHTEVKNRAGQADFLYRVGEVLFVDGRSSEALDREQQALAIFRELGLVRNQGLVLNSLGSIENREGALEESARLHGEALVLLRQVNDRIGVADALNRQANSRQEQGRLADAIAGHRESLALYAEIDHRFGVGVVSDSLARDLLASGELAEASPLFEQAVATFRELDNQPYAAASLGGSAELALLRGDLDLAQRTLDEASVALGGKPDAEVEQAVVLIRARLELERGRPGPAAELARGALRALLRGAARRDYEAALRAVLGRALLESGDTGEARIAAGRALELSAGSERVPVRLDVELVGAQVMAAFGEHQQAVESLAAVRSRATELGLVPLVLEATVARSRLLIAAGSESEGNAGLDEVVDLASAKGIELWAAKARVRGI